MPKKPGKKLPGKWLLLGLLAVGMGIGGNALWSFWKNRTPAAPARKPGAAVIRSNGEVTISGKIRPAHITTVSSDVEGNLDSFQVEVGQDVFEGQVLARIGASGLDASRASAEAAVFAAQDQVQRSEQSVGNARMESSRADADMQRSRMAMDQQQRTWDRAQTLFSAGAGSKQAYEKAQRDFQAARQDLDIRNQAARGSADQLQTALNAQSAARTALAQKQQELEQAQNNMAQGEVRSPVDGLVVSRSGEVGKPVTGDLFGIATDMFALEVVLQPQPQFLGKIQPEQPVLVLIPDLQSAGIPGKVKEIRGTDVIVQFESTLAGIKPGMLADVRFKLD